MRIAAFPGLCSLHGPPVPPPGDAAPFIPSGSRPDQRSDGGLLTPSGTVVRHVVSGAFEPIRLPCLFRSQLVRLFNAIDKRGKGRFAAAELSAFFRTCGDDVPEVLGFDGPGDRGYESDACPSVCNVSAILLHATLRARPVAADDAAC